MAFALALAAFLVQDPETVFREIPAFTHRSQTVPPAADFDRILRRDLETYFARSRGTDLIVDWELLRDGPTQSGVAYPKFYAWVRVRRNGAIVDQGAVRLAAIDRKLFEVTDFVPETSIRTDGAKLDDVFPAQVAETIRRRLGLSR